MDWDLELENSKLQDMIIIYEKEIKKLEQEKKLLRKEVLFLKAQLEYKTLGNHETLNDEE